MNSQSGQVFAIKVLGWLAGNDDLWPVFLGATGASNDDAVARAQDPEFLGSVLDFLMMDDAWVMGCCQELGVDNQDPKKARMALPGGDQVAWT